MIAVGNFRHWHFDLSPLRAVKVEVSISSRHTYTVDVPLFIRLETAVRSWAGAKGFANMMLFGTPLEVQSAAAAPLI
jgi:hypothetical protein